MAAVTRVSTRPDDGGDLDSRQPAELDGGRGGRRRATSWSTPTPGARGRGEPSRSCGGCAGTSATACAGAGSSACSSADLRRQPGGFHAERDAERHRRQWLVVAAETGAPVPERLAWMHWSDAAGQPGGPGRRAAGARGRRARPAPSARGRVRRRPARRHARADPRGGRRRRRIRRRPPRRRRRAARWWRCSPSETGRRPVDPEPRWWACGSRRRVPVRRSTMVTTFATSSPRWCSTDPRARSSYPVGGRSRRTSRRSIASRPVWRSGAVSRSMPMPPCATSGASRGPSWCC